MYFCGFKVVWAALLFSGRPRRCLLEIMQLLATGRCGDEQQNTLSSTQPLTTTHVVGSTLVYIKPGFASPPLSNKSTFLVPFYCIPLVVTDSSYFQAVYLNNAKQ